MTAEGWRACASATRWARQRQSNAVSVSSSSTNPEPSHRSNGQGPSRRRSGTTLTSRPPAPHPPSLREPVARVIHEPRVLALEREHDVTDRAVAVLGDDDVRLARPLGLLVVVLLAVDEHHEVGVLLDLARVT